MPSGSFAPRSGSSPTSSRRGRISASLARKGDPQGAIREYGEAIRIRPDSDVALVGLGRVLEGQGKWTEAIQAYVDATRACPRSLRGYHALGCALFNTGDMNGAVRAFHEAVLCKPDSPEALWDLGETLMTQGRYREALPWLRKGHELGSKTAGWSQGAGGMLASAEQNAEIEERLDQVLGGQAPRDGSERAAFARLLRKKGRHAESARFYAEAFAEDSSLAESLGNGYRYDAACAAALAAARGGSDALEWRGRAFEWLHADLAAREKMLGGLAATLDHWKHDPDLAAGRDHVRELPEPEREAWRSLWAAVDGALRR